MKDDGGTHMLRLAFAETGNWVAMTFRITTRQECHLIVRCQHQFSMCGGRYMQAGPPSLEFEVVKLILDHKRLSWLVRRVFW